ncbi:MAG: dienelactone hydrolase family protein [Candidatus Eremiobacterota bacterium]
MTSGSIRIPAGSVSLEGDLAVPPGAPGLVLFAHGSGSSRLSPRNRFIAQRLQGVPLATLLVDLLTEEEDRTSYEVRFDIDLMSGRLRDIARWARDQARLPIGYFGSTTGAAAALRAAAQAPELVSAVVSRSGRPDLAGPDLARVQAPTLLVVGGQDWTVMEVNREALEELRCPRELAVVAGATHLFIEPGKLDEVARLAADWFQRHLAGTRTEV